jgi:hypothetical protein
MDDVEDSRIFFLTLGFLQPQQHTSPFPLQDRRIAELLRKKMADQAGEG